MATAMETSTAVQKIKKKGDSVIACEGRVVDCVELADELGFGHTGKQRRITGVVKERKK